MVTACRAFDSEGRHMSDNVDVLHTSVDRLREIVEGLSPDQLETSAYPTEWSVADVLSHLGSGAEIMQRFLADTVAGTETPADFAQSVWDAWNAKSPRAQAADALVTDRSYVDALGSVSESARAAFQFALGPMNVDFAGFVGLRLNEHALHLWDIAVTFDPAASLQPDATDVIIDNLEMMARFTGKPRSAEERVAVRTSAPQRAFTITTGPDAVALEGRATVDAPDLEIPAEGFVRLVYGRLDPAHTPPTDGSADLDALRQVFPGP
jgi:uncharacterized protein (TIGR03083 family)